MKILNLLHTFAVSIPEKSTINNGMKIIRYNRFNYIAIIIGF